MANYIITYDLNGPSPSHREMDDHLSRLTAKRGRVLETVWWVSYPGTAAQLRDQVKTILGSEDLLLVIEANSAAWTKLLVNSDSLKATSQAALETLSQLSKRHAPARLCTCVLGASSCSAMLA